MNILDLIEKETGIVYGKKSSKEWAGPCAFCGGDDRCSIIPDQGRMVCRRCKKSLDSIEFIKTYLNKNYYEACKHLNIQPNYKFSSLDTFTEKPGQNEVIWKPRDIQIPSKLWQEKATAILFQAFKYLLSAQGKEQRSYLNARGISNATIKKARIGYISRSVCFSDESWGLLPEKLRNKKATPLSSSIWIPKGIIIPQFQNKKLIRLRIRQDDPNALTRFIVVKGSASGFFDYSNHLKLNQKEDENLPWIITEAELDGWTIFDQLGSDHANIKIYAIGNSSARPDVNIHNYLKNNPGLVNLDNDGAGQEEAKWWAKKYPDSLTWYSKKEKDPGEDFAAGVDIQKWVKSGVNKLKDFTKIDLKKSDPRQVKNSVFSIDLKNKLFKKPKTIKTIKPSIIKKQNTKQIKKKCVHNLFCVSLKNSICLINKLNPFELSRCPKEKWWKYQLTPNIQEIVLGIGISKN